MSYTAIADSVELGWRFKQLNRRYGTRVIVSDPVQATVCGDFWLRKLDAIPLLGGSEEIGVYELQGERSEPLPAAVTSFVHRYERGLAALRNGDWDQAQPLFEALAKEHPEDASVRLMRMRCEARDACLCPRSIGPETDVRDGLSGAL
jgi:predicted Zn-dependent protease